MANWIPSDLRHYVPQPTLILMGCRAWDNVPAPPCPVCKGGIRKGHDTAHCAKCDSSSPGIEARILAARVGLRARSVAEDADRNATDELRRLKRSEPVLTEAHRRRIWNGYSRNGLSSRNADVVNRAKLGREFLASIGQEPDFNLILDGKGRVVGRHEKPDDGDAA